jgi:hypothetical protein
MKELLVPVCLLFQGHTPPLCISLSLSKSFGLFPLLICWFYILQLQNFSVGEFVGFAAEGHTILEFCLISSPLKEAFPELFNIAQIRNASLADLLRLSNGVIHCNLTFAQSVQDWELESLSAFMELLYSNSVGGSGVDTICWRPTKGQQFTVGTYFRSLSDSVDVSFPWRIIWRSRVPPRVSFYVWTEALGKILTIDNLWRRHTVVIDWCCIYKDSGESVDHFIASLPYS